MPKLNPELQPTPETQTNYPELEQWLELELEKQYQDQIKIYRQNNLIELNPELKQMGIYGIDHKFYIFPDLKTIEHLIRQNPEFYNDKIKQGLTELDIVPFALPLSKLFHTLEECLKRHYQEKKLFATKKNMDVEKEELKPLDLNLNQPLWLTDSLKLNDQGQSADETGELVYDIKQFDQENHGGQSKTDILKDKTDPFTGFHVLLRARADKQRLKAGNSPRQYLEQLQTNPDYQGETGSCPEDWLMKFINTLEKYKQVINDWQGNGKAEFLINCYLISSGYVLRGFFNRDLRQAFLYGSAPDYSRAYIGASFLARINNLKL